MASEAETDRICEDMQHALQDVLLRIDEHGDAGGSAFVFGNGVPLMGFDKGVGAIKWSLAWYAGMTGGADEFVARVREKMLDTYDYEATETEIAGLRDMYSGHVITKDGKKVILWS